MWGAGAWLLGGLCPVGELTIWDTMSRACSASTPLPPNGESVPSLLPRPVFCSPLAPSPPIRLAVGGLYRSRAPPPITCIRPRTKGVRSCLGGAPLPSHGRGSPPPPSPACCVQGGRMLLGGCSPFTLLVRGPPPFPLLQTVRGERTLLGRCPPFFLLVCPPLPP